MTETMFSILALSIVMLFSLSQSRGKVQSQRELAAIELEVMANAVASETMQYLAKQPFDEHTKDGTITLQNQNLALLTPASAFPSGWSIDACQDVDDFNNMAPDTVLFQMDLDEAGNPTGLPFLVTAQVSYIDEAGNQTTAPTWTKEITLFVDQLVEPGGVRYLLQPVVKKRRVSPSWTS
ncbi:MAG: hypothetical protein ACE10K_09995 [Rhodothermales bacterium]